MLRMRPVATRVLRMLVATALVLSPARLTAAESADVVAARALFEEARGLMKAGHYDAACPKLEAASKLYSGPGVLLNLGACYESAGRLAKAWAEFGEAATAAAAEGKSEYEAEARRRRAALDARVPRLVVHVAAERPDLLVLCDGAPLDRSSWGAAVPVDAGAHVVSAALAGRQVWSVSLTIASSGETVRVEVPELRPPASPREVEVTQAAPTSAPSGVAGSSPSAQPQSTGSPADAGLHPTPASDAVAPDPGPVWRGRRILAGTMGGIGLLGLGTSVALLLAAESRFAAAEGESGSGRASDSQDAVMLARQASLAFAFGAALAASGLVLWLTEPHWHVQVGGSAQTVFVRAKF